MLDAQQRQFYCAARKTNKTLVCFWYSACLLIEVGVYFRRWDELNLKAAVIKDGGNIGDTADRLFQARGCRTSLFCDRGHLGNDTFLKTLSKLCKFHIVSKINSDIYPNSPTS